MLAGAILQTRHKACKNLWTQSEVCRAGLGVWNKTEHIDRGRSDDALAKKRRQSDLRRNFCFGDLGLLN